MPDAIDRIIEAVQHDPTVTEAEREESLKVFFDMYHLWTQTRHVTYFKGFHADGMGTHDLGFYEDHQQRGGILVPQALDKLDCPELWAAIGEWMLVGGPLQKVWDEHVKWMEARHRAKKVPT